MPANAGIQVRGGVAGADMHSRFRGNACLFMGPFKPASPPAWLSGRTEYVTALMNKSTQPAAV